jgi:hypothetical protein
MDADLRKLLDTFWTAEAVFPSRQGAEGGGDGVEGAEDGEVTRKSRPVAADDHELLSIWRVLEAVDPAEAQRWHWRDGRKERRGLERWWERGGGAVVSEQSNHSGRQAK